MQNQKDFAAALGMLGDALLHLRELTPSEPQRHAADCVHAAKTTLQPMLGQPEPPYAAITALCFIAETVAHLRGQERDILPHTDAVRAWLSNRK